jgi:hypothetical protein
MPCGAQGRDATLADEMRAALIAVAAATLGCGGTTAPVRAAKESPAVDGGADDAAEESAPSPAEAGVDRAAPPAPLAWSESGSSILFDIIALWGSTDGAVYVGTDEGIVYRVDPIGSTDDTTLSSVGGAGWGGDPKHVFAVGTSAWLKTGGSGGLYDWTGEGWNSLAAGPFNAVWASTGSDVYAGGSGGVVHAADGRTFMRETGIAGAVLGLGGSGATDIYATTSSHDATILHSSGDGAWQSVFAQPTGSAWAVWSGASGEAYAVVSPTADGDPDAFVLHGSGGAWMPESVGQAGSVLVAVWGSGPGDVYVAGWHAGAKGLVGDLFHSTGDGTWSRIDLPGEPYQVTSVWGSGPDSVYVGVFDVEGGPTLLRGQR